MPRPEPATELLVDGGGIDGGSGIFFANAGVDVHAVGSLAPTSRPRRLHRDQADGSRFLARAVPDPLT